MVLLSLDWIDFFTGSYLTYGMCEKDRVEQEMQAPCLEYVCANSQESHKLKKVGQSFTIEA